MKYVIIDDEVNASNLLKRILERYEGLKKDDEIILFNDSLQAWEYLQTHTANLIFLDIEMPRMTGTELAEHIVSELSPKPYIVFITAFPQYSLFAWDTGAVSYILKPYKAQSVYDAIEKYKKLSADSGSQDPLSATDSPKPFIRCFPDFELLTAEGEPVFFKNKKSMELLAYLVHNQGNWVPLEKITYSLFEDLDEVSSKNYLRTVLYRLKKTLSEHGLRELVESKYGSMRVNPNAFRCDYYQYLDGKTSLFQGDYMGEYSWAESTRAFMYRGI